MSQWDSDVHGLEHQPVGWAHWKPICMSIEQQL